MAMKLNHEKLMKLCSHYPEFTDLLLLRVNLRRAHWRKVYVENRHELLLQRKLETVKSINASLGLHHLNELFVLEVD